MLFLFLPALLWWESLTTSLREIRATLRGIVLVSTVLVVLEAAAVAVVAHAVVLPWGPAWVLGAAVAPTDATAVGAIARVLPLRSLTVLRAESLINDGTALVVLGVAISATTGPEQLTAGHVVGLFAGSYSGGLLAGLVAAGLAALVRRSVQETLPEAVVMLITPFAAFVLAELVSASGVVAVVTAGLVLSQVGPKVGSAQGRQVTSAFYSVLSYALNGALFALVGLQAQTAVRQLDNSQVNRGLVAVVAVTATLLVVRYAFLVVTAYTLRVVDQRPAQRGRRVSNRSRVVSSLAGIRGAVSLAAALSVPATTSGGSAFPARDLVVFVTVGVITLTVLQGLLLPPAVRWAQLPPDRVAQERHDAEVAAGEHAAAALPQLAADLGVAAPVLQRLQDEYAALLRAAARQQGPDRRADDPDDPARAAQDDEHDDLLEQLRQDTALRLAALADKRAVVLGLRDRRTIDDTVLRQIQTHLDREEVRLRRPATLE